MQVNKKSIISRLRQEILNMEGFNTSSPEETPSGINLSSVQSAFPNNTFPTGCIHEFISQQPEHTAAAAGFIAGLLRMLASGSDYCVWISCTRRIYPPSLQVYGLDPSKVIFIDVPLMRDLLWVTEEVLKCQGLKVVVCELSALSFRDSRRLQLAVKKSHVTGLILRKDVRQLTTSASVARWHIKPAPSKLRGGMPGVGAPRWEVELQKVRSGKPGKWIIEWQGGFIDVGSNKGTLAGRKYA